MRQLIARIAERLLQWLDRFYLKQTGDTPARYPYDKRRNTIRLPRAVEKEIYDMVAANQRTQAVQRVAELTGAGLVLSKQYVDRLATAPRPKGSGKQKAKQRQRRRRR